MTLFVREYEDQPAPQELVAMGSVNHSFLQAELAMLLRLLGAYFVLVELTLDVASAPFEELGIEPRKTLKPDISLYKTLPLSRSADVVKMTEMPLLAVEILSPWQGSKGILDKFKIYFALGVQSCWFVDPTLAAIAVYHSPSRSQVFFSGDIVDEALNITLSTDTVFKELR